mmetsp:Transcript_12731/g.12838  ORF Transcript_12731/g.12838 Transcript_12731/m.12838 type:complete len:103 (-) Transcript_12731:288-596(-)
MYRQMSKESQFWTIPQMIIAVFEGITSTMIYCRLYGPAVHQIQQCLLKYTVTLTVNFAFPIFDSLSGNTLQKQTIGVHLLKHPFPTNDTSVTTSDCYQKYQH